MSKAFLDTNLLIYSFDPRDSLKRARARQCLSTVRSGANIPVISTQVLQEFYNGLTQKLKVDSRIAAAELKVLLDIEIVNLTAAIIMLATDLHAADSISFWDALIVAAAQSVDCDEIWTEDMQTGRNFGKLKIVNPFAAI